jgi:hypothetical protein
MSRNKPVAGGALMPNGENMLDVNAELGVENSFMRKKISAAQ